MNHGWGAWVSGQGLLEELQWQTSIPKEERVLPSWHSFLLQAAHEGGHSEPGHKGSLISLKQAANYDPFLFKIFLTPNTSDTRFLRPSNSSVFCRHKLGVLQFNSDSNHLELVKSPQFEGSVPRDCPHFRVSFVSGIRFDNMLEQRTELLFTITSFL